jgi:hypothetical protein
MDPGQNTHYAAFWSIGNSKINQGNYFVSYLNEYYIEYAAADMFKYCGARTDFNHAMRSCGNLVEMESGIFDTWVNATNLTGTFEYFTWVGKPRIDLSHCTKITNLSNAFQYSQMDRLPVIESRKITSISYFCQSTYIHEIRRGDIPANEEGASINSGYAFYVLSSGGNNIFEFPDAITSLGSRFLYGSSWSSGDIIQIFQTVPPIAQSDSLPTLSSLESAGVFIYVPDESVDAYKAASYWSDLASRIKPASEKPAE